MRAFKWWRQQPVTWRGNPPDVDPWADPAPRGPVIEDLLARLDQVSRYERPQLWKARRRGSPQPSSPPRELPWGAPGWHGEVAKVAADLDGLGYFDDDFGSLCPDSHDDHAGTACDFLRHHVGAEEGLWPLMEGDGRPAESLRHLDDDDMLTLVEALHLVVARPRGRFWHDF